MAKTKKFVISFFLCCMSVVLTMSHCFAQVSGENQLKAAFLFNFARLIDWPEGAFKEDTFVLCSEKNNKINEFLIRYQDKSVRGRRLEFKAVADASAAQNCHIVFLDDEDSNSFKNFTPNLDSTTLWVSDRKGFADCTGHIELAVDEDRPNKLKLRINTSNTGRSGFHVSSRILIRSEVLKNTECER